MKKENLKKGMELDDKIREAQMQLNAGEAFLTSDKDSFVIQLSPGTYGIIITKEEMKPFILKNIENKKAALKQLESEFEQL